VNVVITEDSQLSDSGFDLVLAYEFYPFTRTTDWSMHKKYLDMCLKNCNPGGYVVLGMPESCNGTWNNIMTENEDKVIAEYGELYKGKYSIGDTLRHLMIFQKPDIS